jgi:hypothetical protein
MDRAHGHGHGITGETWLVNFACDSDFHINHRVLLHAAYLRPGTDGFTSPPKEGMLWILRPGSNPRSRVPEASTLTTRPPKPLHMVLIDPSFLKGQNIKIQIL